MIGYYFIMHVHAYPYTIDFYKYVSLVLLKGFHNYFKVAVKKIQVTEACKLSRDLILFNRI